ncbi:MAG: ABC transporter ATP-binding protein [Xanthobacteraceae bacterium]|nr:MAG: ABC transporter ATP-binding protein [Xanthobacteraceae bacterium]
MPLLATHNLDAYYGDFQALFGIETYLEEGETVAIIGANGAGKSTFLKSICGLLKVSNDCVVYAGHPIGGLRATSIVRQGIAMIPEGRRLFPSLTVEENLLIGRYGRNVAGPWTLETIFALFPILKERRSTPSTALSGGQQQMVAIGRALISNPRVLLCDEISLGLAPIVIRDIYQALQKIRETGTSVILVEQDIVRAMQTADRVYCFQEGRLSLSGKPNELTRERIQSAYFGT